MLMVVTFAMSYAKSLEMRLKLQLQFADSKSIKHPFGIHVSMLALAAQHDRKGEYYM